VKNTVRYRVLSGEFHGFYFGGLGNVTAYFDTETAFGIDSGGRTYKLDIKNLGDKYDIVLANGRGVRSGEVTYTFRFGTNMRDAGYLAHTRSSEGNDLIVFNWAPSEWDEPMEHYTVKVVYPWEYTGSATDRESVLEKFEELTFRTEKWMNEQYKIDYRVEEVEGKRWMAVLLHKENPGSHYHFGFGNISMQSLPRHFIHMAGRGTDRSRQPAGSCRLQAPLHSAADHGKAGCPVAGGAGIWSGNTLCRGHYYCLPQTQVHAACAGRPR
jgi:hypothetical protein